MKLAGIVSEGSGKHNEDAAGIIEHNGEVTAAWVIDGVTGINECDALPEPSDAAWLVGRIDARLRCLAPQALQLPELLRFLVDGLMRDWQEAVASIRLPAGFDMPAACLLLAKRYPDGWRALRLGDPVLLVEDQGRPRRLDGAPTELGNLENMLRLEAARRRGAGLADFKALLTEFRPQLMASRRTRNTPGSHSILLPDASALNLPEFLDLGHPSSILLCTDGFYRAVDIYGPVDEADLMAACKPAAGVNALLSRIRAVESSDQDCRRYPRFKPADDASAVVMVQPSGSQCQY